MVITKLKQDELYYFYVPAYRPAYIENAMHLSIKNIIFCLEDGTPEEKKEEARLLTKYALKEFQNFNKNFIIRINGIETLYWEKDLEEVLTDIPPDRIRIPMLQDAKQFDQIVKKVQTYTNNDDILYEIMIENESVFENIKEIIQITDRIYCFTVGGEDLKKDLEKKYKNPIEKSIQIKKQLCDFCKNIDIPCFDTTFMDYRNKNAFYTDCLESHSLGFSGRSIIHPDQIETIVDIYDLQEY